MLGVRMTANVCEIFEFGAGQYFLSQKYYKMSIHVQKWLRYSRERAVQSYIVMFYHPPDV